MIQQKEIFKKIGAIIVEINEQYQYLSENPEQLNDLELELFSANADFLSEHVKILRRINKGASSAQAKNVPANTALNNVEPASAIVSTPDLQTEVKPVETRPVERSEQRPPVTVEVKPSPTLFEPVREPEPVPAEEPQPVEEPSPAIVEEEKVTEPEEKQEEIAPVEPVIVATESPVVKEVVIPEKVTIVEVAESSNPAPTLNDLISAQKAQSIQTSPYASKPVTDLKTAISLNDKLLFIKDLFNGYSLAYSEAIEILNRFESFDIAETFLKTNYATKNNWQAKQDSVEKFYAILQRRYTK